MYLLKLSLVSHLICDFILQSKNMVLMKYERKARGYLYHFLTHFFVSFILVIFAIKHFLMSFGYALVFSFIHILIDILKDLFKKDNAKKDLLVFLLDQLVHVATIFLLAYYIIYVKSITVFTYPSFNYLNYLYYFSMDIDDALTVIIFYLIVLFAGSILLEKILKVIDIKIKDEDEISMGKYIGIIERALILTIVVFGEISSIGIIFTAKSLARYKELSEKRFVEYYLLGTLSSLFLALMGGLILRSLLYW